MKNKKNKKVKERNIFNRIKMATVAMSILHEGDNRKPFTILGSGFCIHPRGIVITCRHVLSAFSNNQLNQYIAEIPDKDQKKNISPIREIHSEIPHVIFYNAITPGQLIAFPVRVDIAMVKINYDLGMVRLHKHAAFQKGFPTAEIEDYININEGQEIATCGFPLGNYLQDQLGTVTSSFTRGIVSSFIPSPNVPREYLKGFQLNLTATHGNSGGPVFTLNSGKIFGILQRGVIDHEGKLLPGITKAEPIYPLLENNTLERILEAPSGQFPSS